MECLPSYVSDITQTYLIPVKPVKQKTAIQFGRPGPPRDGKRPPKGERPRPPKEGEPRPPRQGEEGQQVPETRGLAFNGVNFNAPAPVDAILGAYTLAPFDDAGGHINLNAGYHYHAATGASTEILQSDGHAPMIGYAIDGHGIYGRLDESGNEPTDLDDCRGHYDEVRGYHYHVDAAGTNNFINCLQGAYAQ